MGTMSRFLLPDAGIVVTHGLLPNQIIHPGVAINPHLFKRWVSYHKDHCVPWVPTFEKPSRLYNFSIRLEVGGRVIFYLSD